MLLYWTKDLLHRIHASDRGQKGDLFEGKRNSRATDRWASQPQNPSQRQLATISVRCMQCRAGCSNCQGVTMDSEPEIRKSESLGKHGIQRKESLSTCQCFPRADEERVRCCLLPRGKQLPYHRDNPLHPASLPVSDPEPSPWLAYPCPHNWMQGFVQRKQSVHFCWKTCPLVFWVDLPSRKWISTENWVHLSAFSHIMINRHYSFLLFTSAH